MKKCNINIVTCSDWKVSFSRWFAEHPGLLTLFCGPKPCATFSICDFGWSEWIFNRVAMWSVIESTMWILHAHTWHWGISGYGLEITVKFFMNLIGKRKKIGTKSISTHRYTFLNTQYFRLNFYFQLCLYQLCHQMLHKSLFLGLICIVMNAKRYTKRDMILWIHLVGTTWQQ